MRQVISLILVLPLLAFSTFTYADCNDPYPPSLVRGFTRDCVRGPRMQAFCGCVIDRIQKTISLSDFIETGSRPEGLNRDPRVIKATGECSAKYPPEAPDSK